MLYGHPWSSERIETKPPQYYNINKEFFEQSVADELEEQIDTPAELLKQFAASLERHRYEEKTTTVKIRDHVKRMEHIAGKAVN